MKHLLTFFKDVFKAWTLESTGLEFAEELVVNIYSTNKKHLEFVQDLKPAYFHYQI